MEKAVIVTCGPGFEPIDAARRLTNMSTGELGVMLCEGLTALGFKVICFKGSAAVWPDPRGDIELQKFDTNDDLLELFQTVSLSHNVTAIFHTAALCDYKVKAVTNASGASVRSEKIATRDGNIFLELEPSLKVLPLLRQLFAAAEIIGWKYELSGTRQDALAKADRQIETARSNACVVNGKAFGPGFGFRAPGLPLMESFTKLELVQFLTGRLLSAAAKPALPLEIKKLLRINGNLLTGGMPLPCQLQYLANEKVEVVINLALASSDNAIPNEGELVTSMAMAYFHIPVQFDDPKPRDYFLFEKILLAVADKRTFVHCAANMRVSAFIYIFHLRNNILPEPEAKKFLNQIWEPEGKWKSLMEDLLQAGNR